MKGTTAVRMTNYQIFTVVVVRSSLFAGLNRTRWTVDWPRRHRLRVPETVKPAQFRRIQPVFCRFDHDKSFGGPLIPPSIHGYSGYASFHTPHPHDMTSVALLTAVPLLRGCFRHVVKYPCALQRAQLILHVSTCRIILFEHN